MNNNKYMENNPQQVINFENNEVDPKIEYKKLFGVNPDIYFLTDQEIKIALDDPEAEKVRLYQLALQENQEDINSMYGK